MAYALHYIGSKSGREVVMVYTIFVLIMVVTTQVFLFRSVSEHNHKIVRARAHAQVLKDTEYTIKGEWL